MLFSWMKKKKTCTFVAICRFLRYSEESILHVEESAVRIFAGVVVKGMSNEIGTILINFNLKYEHQFDFQFQLKVRFT